MKEIDCRKQFCPVPVVNTKKAIESGEDNEIEVLVDNIPSRDNVKRFAKNLGNDVDVVEEDGYYRIKIKVNPDAVAAMAKGGAVPGSHEYSIFITSSVVGDGDERLGHILMKAFLNTVGDSQPLPTNVIFMNDGVKLACEGSEVLDSIAALVEKGVDIYVCGTCLNYYDIVDQVKYGTVSNMFEIVNLLLDAPKVIKI
jgi:selenium metabolism protein YedF